MIYKEEGKVATQAKKYRKDGKNFTIYFKSNHLKEKLPLGLLTSLTITRLAHLLLIPGYYVFFPYESWDDVVQNLLPKVTEDLKEKEP